MFTCLYCSIWKRKTGGQRCLHVFTVPFGNVHHLRVHNFRHFKILFHLNVFKIIRKRIIFLSILFPCEQILIQMNTNHFHDEKYECRQLKPVVIG